MKYAKNFYGQEGYVALVSVILISATLLMLVAVIAASGFYVRANVLDYENKKISSALAEACVATALANLAEDPPGYPAAIPLAGMQVAVDAGKTCRICSVTADSPYTIAARAVYKDSYTNLFVTGTFSTSNFVVTAWEELASYPGNDCFLP